jgi:hypothetical protein
MDAWLAPFRRFWLAYVNALERHLDRKDRWPEAKKEARKPRRGQKRERDKGEKKI